MSESPGRGQIESTLRGVRYDVSREDPAGFRPRRQRGKHPEVLVDEYVTPALRAGHALLYGASVHEALDEFRREMARLYPGRNLSRRAMVKLARRWGWQTWWDSRLFRVTWDPDDPDSV